MQRGGHSLQGVAVALPVAVPADDGRITRGALRCVCRRGQLQQESSKAVLHVLMDTAVIISLLLSDTSLPHSPSPAPALAVGAFLLALGMVR